MSVTVIYYAMSGSFLRWTMDNLPTLLWAPRQDHDQARHCYRLFSRLFFHFFFPTKFCPLAFLFKVIFLFVGVNVYPVMEGVTM